jgi:DnaJ-class molecular chaperone
MTVIRCRDCHDEGACRAHEMREDPVGAAIWCTRCAGTGNFVTGVENGVPTGPGGPCFRCGGKGHHVRTDRRRNWGYARTR